MEELWGGVKRREVCASFLLESKKLLPLNSIENQIRIPNDINTRDDNAQEEGEE